MDRIDRNDLYQAVKMAAVLASTRLQTQVMPFKNGTFKLTSKTKKKRDYILLKIDLKTPESIEELKLAFNDPTFTTKELITEIVKNVLFLVNDLT